VTELNPELARTLWYITETNGFVETIATALHKGEVDTMGSLLRLKDKGLARPLYNVKARHYQWCLTEQGLAEHERRMNRANRIAAGDT
jgi:hypothetical protein